jgi:hypothetical protein
VEEDKVLILALRGSLWIIGFFLNELCMEACMEA